MSDKSSSLKEIKPLKVHQLKKLLENTDDNSEILVWLEEEIEGVQVVECKSVVGVNDEHGDLLLFIKQ